MRANIFILLFFFLILNRIHLPAQAADRFFDINYAESQCSSMISDPNLYTHPDLQKLVEQYGFFPSGIEAHISEKWDEIINETEEELIKDALSLGHPVWNRSRWFPTGLESEVLAVPLVKKSSHLTEGVLFYRFDNDGFYAVEVKSREQLELYYLNEESSWVDSDSYFKQLLIAAFDNVLFNSQSISWQALVPPSTRFEYYCYYHQDFPDHRPHIWFVGDKFFFESYSSDYGLVSMIYGDQTVCLVGC